MRPAFTCLCLVLLGASIASAEDAKPTRSVTIYRDTWGVPHIYAKTPAEGAFGLGYAQAEDRLDDIYIGLRTGLGRMSEAFGKKHVEQDYIMRLCRNEEIAREYHKKAPAAVREISVNFTAGIQKFIDEHPERVPAFALKIEAWQIGTIGRAMTLRWPLGTIMDDLNEGKKRDQAGKNVPMRSNEWAIGPSRTADKVPILLADPHLTWEGLAVMYEARVHAGDLHMNGFFLAGSPILGIGHNNRVGWALTTGGPDTSDVYRMKIKIGAPIQYEYDGKWLDTTTRLISIPVKGQLLPETRPAITTHLGPFITQPDPKTGEVFVGASPYLEQTRLAEQFYTMTMSTNVKGVYDALGMNQYNEQNVMFADVEGSIAYVRNGATPIRPKGYDWSAPVPGHTSATAWKGLHPVDDLVHIINPPAGYMQNCNISPINMMKNSPLTPDKYPEYIYNVSWDDQNPRSVRAVELLDGNSAVTEEQAISYVMDVHDVLATRWQTALRAAVDAAGAKHSANKDFAAAVKAILAWDGEFVPESKASPVYKFWRLKCGQAGLDLRPIADGKPLDAAAQAKLLDQLVATIAEMQKKYRKWDVAWGDIHKVGRGGKYFPVGGADFQSGDKKSNFSETLFDVNCKEDPKQPGVHVATNGSMAMIVMFFHKDGVKSFTCTPWGQSADPKSPHYMDQGEKLYSKRVMKPSWWSEAELLQHVESKREIAIP